MKGREGGGGSWRFCASGVARVGCFPLLPVEPKNGVLVDGTAKRRAIRPPLGRGVRALSAASSWRMVAVARGSRARSGPSGRAGREEETHEAPP